MADSGTEAEKVLDEHLLVLPESKELLKTQKDEGMSKGHSQPEIIPNGQS